MSSVHDLLRLLVARLKLEGIPFTVSGLVSDWDLAEKTLSSRLTGCTLFGLSQLPDGPGNFIWFTRAPQSNDWTSSLEVGGGWIWSKLPMASLSIQDDEPFPSQDTSALLAAVNQHIGQRVVSVRLWRSLPHLAIEFSDGSVLRIHGDAGNYESWGFSEGGSQHIGVYALPGGGIAVTAGPS